MQHGLGRIDGHLDATNHLGTPVNHPSRERRDTTWSFTVARRQRVWLAVAVAIALALAACGGGKRTDTYAKATDKQSSCCMNLAGAERDKCMSEIVRIEDPAATKTPTSQQTYACVAEHFVCNPQTGRPTQPSAQAQLDCIEGQQQ